MPSIVANAGQSLLTIAKNQLSSNATPSQIQDAARLIAESNGLALDEPIRAQQTLQVPDLLAAAVTTNANTRDAMPRLASPAPRNGILQQQLNTRAKPMVSFQAVFSNTVTKPLGSVDLEPVAGVKPQAQMHQFQGVASSMGNSSLTTVDAVLGPLSQSAFAAVHQEFGGHSRVQYDANRSYRISDFLPPTLQALLNQDLEIPKPVTLKGSKKVVEEPGWEPSDLSVGLTMNCHATAWEAARAYQGSSDQVAIFYGEMILMADMVSDETKFTHIGEVDAAHLDELNQLDLKPGDIVQFHEVSDWARMTMLLHSAVYVGDGLFFEKPNTEGDELADPDKYIPQEETPFRLTTLAGMAEPIHQAVDGSYRVTVHRPIEELADPIEAFGSGLTEPLSAWAQTKGRQLGTELVQELEQGSGGGIIGIGVSALVRVGLVDNEDGTTRLAK